MKYIYDKSYHASAHIPAWRNGLARWSSNPKVVGSTPAVGAYYYILGKVEFQQVICFLRDCHILNGRIYCVRP